MNGNAPMAGDVITIIVDQFLPAKHIDMLRVGTCEQCGSQNRVLADGTCVDCWEERFPGLSKIGEESEGGSQEIGGR